MNILYINKFFPFNSKNIESSNVFRYYPRGGTETLLLTLDELFRKRGHTTFFFAMKHPENMKAPCSDYFAPYIDLHESKGILNTIKGTARILYSVTAQRKLGQLLDDYHVDIAHLHNIAHQLSPSVIYELKRRKIPIVMTLHDYKMVCPVYNLLSHGKLCDLCRNKQYYHCFIHRCHKDSYLKSFIVMLESYLHMRLFQSYAYIASFICPSRFIMDKVREMGLKGNFMYLPNFIDPHAYTPQTTWDEKSIVYVGRLSHEKGLWTLVRAVKDIKNITLKIIGDGPLGQHLISFIQKHSIDNIRFLGFLRGESLKDEIKKSMFFVLASECYENNPYSILEGFAIGKCVVASRIGGITELCRDFVTGLTFSPGDVDDLRSKIEYLLDHPDTVIEMGHNARIYIEDTFDEEQYVLKLLDIYSSVGGRP
jgi:glycosyltransferase involved in cell wall biosynthesis